LLPSGFEAHHERDLVENGKHSDGAVWYLVEHDGLQFVLRRWGGEVKKSELKLCLSMSLKGRKVHGVGNEAQDFQPPPRQNWEVELPSLKEQELHWIEHEGFCKSHLETPRSMRKTQDNSSLQHLGQEARMILPRPTASPHHDGTFMVNTNPDKNLCYQLGFRWDAHGKQGYPLAQHSMIGTTIIVLLHQLIIPSGSRTPFSAAARHVVDMEQIRRNLPTEPPHHPNHPARPMGRWDKGRTSRSMAGNAREGTEEQTRREAHYGRTVIAPSIGQAVRRKSVSTDKLCSRVPHCGRAGFVPLALSTRIHHR
jgi:hypothetical protein